MPKHIRVMYLGSTLARQGPVFQLYNLVKYLDRDRFEPVILTLSPEPKESLLESFQKLDVPCYSLGLSRLAGAIVGVSELREFLQNHPVDIIHSFGLRADMLSAVCFRGIPRIATLHADYECRRESHGPMLGRMTGALHLWGLRRLECVACCSEHISKEIKSNLQIHAHTIQNGIDQVTFSPTGSVDRTLLRRRLGVPQDGRIFISAGHLLSRKDPITVMKGFLFSSAAKGAAFVFLGDGPLRGECERLAGGHNNVLIVGAVSNVADYLRAADVLVSASLAEGLPLTVIEGLACGLPVVLSDIDAHREVLAFDPMAGKLFPAKDVSALAQTLEEIMNADYESMQQAALSIVRDHLNARRMSSQYQSLYIDCYKEYKES